MKCRALIDEKSTRWEEELLNRTASVGIIVLFSERNFIEIDLSLRTRDKDDTVASRQTDRAEAQARADEDKLSSYGLADVHRRILTGNGIFAYLEHRGISADSELEHRQRRARLARYLAYSVLQGT
ncbi:unnamed protein product [Vicia faba]|uniref:Uncharacterized protein n=1 Tax=Vicia faba TaxID=3906 RepID=A0AAV1A657_VICFA|nr:unnamed protein product [Vicia faba]